MIGITPSPNKWLLTSRASPTGFDNPFEFLTFKPLYFAGDIFFFFLASDYIFWIQCTSLSLLFHSQRKYWNFADQIKYTEFSGLQPKVFIVADYSGSFTDQILVCFFCLFFYEDRSINQGWLVGWLVGWVLWHINHCRLFNAKFIFIHINSFITNSSV